MAAYGREAIHEVRAVGLLVEEALVEFQRRHLILASWRGWTT
jgi:hypothetical protein